MVPLSYKVVELKEKDLFCVLQILITRGENKLTMTFLQRWTFLLRVRTPNGKMTEGAASCEFRIRTNQRSILVL